MGKGRPIVKYRDTLRSSVQKRLNRSICRLVVDSGGQKEAQVQWHSPGGANVPSWEGTLVPLNRPSAAAMRPYVKLL